jgi:hypothetical protein
MDDVTQQNAALVEQAAAAAASLQDQAGQLSQAVPVFKLEPASSMRLAQKPRTGLHETPRQLNRLGNADARAGQHLHLTVARQRERRRIQRQVVVRASRPAPGQPPGPEHSKRTRRGRAARICSRPATGSSADQHARRHGPPRGRRNSGTSAGRASGTHSCAPAARTSKIALGRPM